MDITTSIQYLEREWDEIKPGGFFAELGLGIFDDAGFQRVRDILDSIEIPEGETLDKRFVEVVWFIPTFMRWQQDAWRIDGKNTKQLDEAISFFEQRLTTILGLP